MSVKSSPPALKISVFGGLHVETPYGETIRLCGQKDQALLGFLAVSPGISHSREKLAALLWSHSGDRQARDSLKQALLRLRRSFDPIVEGLLITDRQSVMLAPDRIRVDVGLFEELLRDHAPESTRQAALLYCGDLLDGIVVRAAAFEDWLQIERERLRTLVTAAWSDLMAWSLDHYQRDRAVEAARRLLSFEPLHETACRTLMWAQVERGERAQALKLFETLRSRLEQELAVAPEPETVTLYHSIRNRRASQGIANQGTLIPTVRDFQIVDGSWQGAVAKPSIAVLPFSIIGDNPEQDYLADGITEDIITDLSQVSGLFVASRHSAFIFKGKQIQARRVARKLDVSHILQGSVRASARRLRITMQLIDAASDKHVWAKRYDRNLDDIFAVQDEIAKSVVSVLKIKLLPEELGHITRHSTISVDAYQYFLMGRSFYLRGMGMNNQSLARKMFHRAIEIDPRYARAYANLAACESYLSMSDPHVTHERCVANSLRALELDPTLAEAHAARGLVLYAEGRYAEAALKFELALSLGPDLYDTYFLFARNCHLQGLNRKAAGLFEKAITLRPNDYRALGQLAAVYKILDRHDDFNAAALQCIERIEEATETHPENADALAFGSTLLGHMGDYCRAEAWADRAVVIAPNTPIVRYNAAITQIFLDRVERALDWLEQAFRSTPEWQRRLASWMKHDQYLDPLRSHPRVRTLLAHLEREAA